ncbi:uncharacterized protein BCR38DRAFT_345606 [Pseudomassariella vexata]|uniref:Translation initiation factor eIF2B subunit beta n=1 Tax=Pseudomassariella vexata TaxID=1141098 RepID=A0A1Y2DUR0_9PEZI|nr:uncharacterized protein BCR38DRAFT_345606 [Pseudomassariella vexata]ORY63010.1 hypothetical protein BCR38DRAFT_345606 [Pseudomassariella vexata]
MAPPKGGYAPNLDKFLDSLKGPVDTSVEFLIALLKRRQIKGSEPCAVATARILLQVVAKEKWTDVDQLIERIRVVGTRLVAAQPRELVIGNVVKRVLRLIRDEAMEDRNEAGGDSSPASPASMLPTPIVESIPDVKPFRPPTLNSLGSFARTQSMFSLLADPDVAPPLWSNGTTPAAASGTSTPLSRTALSQATNISALRSEVIDGIEEIMDEIKQVDDQVQTYADIIIHPGNYILVYQPSRTVQKFLTRCKRKFNVLLVVDPSTATSTEDLYASFRKSLVAGGSTVVKVMNTGLMAYMPRVNKVILEARAITATGEVVVDSGAASIARAARQQGRTVIVVGGVYKLSPDSQANQTIEWGDPSKYVNFSDGQMVGHVKVKNAVSESVPEADTYLTNLGANSKEYLHVIIEDHYKEEDIGLDLYGTIRK